MSEQSELCPICGNELVEKHGELVCPITDDNQILHHMRRNRQILELKRRLLETESELRQLERSAALDAGVADDLSQVRQKVERWRVRLQRLFDEERAGEQEPLSRPAR